MKCQEIKSQQSDVKQPEESVDLNVVHVSRALGVGVEAALMPLNGSSNLTLKHLLVL